MKTRSSQSTPPDKIFDVWIVDDNLQFSAIVSDALNESGRVICSRAFHRCDEFLSELRTSAALPDIVVLDVRMAGAYGLKTIPCIRAVSPSTKVIVLSAYVEHRYVFDAFSRGASGYLLKTSSSVGQILDAIGVVTTGGVVMDENAAAILMKSIMQRYAPSLKYGLTEKELEIVSLIPEGLKSREIADKLHISESTMIPHLKKIFYKLDVHNRAALVAKVIKEDIV